MDQALIGAAVGATIQVVLQNLLSFSIDEIARVYGFKKDLSKLKESLELIQDFLYDAEAKQVTDRAVKSWLVRLEDVAFKADAVLDEFNYQLLRKRVKKQDRGTRKVTAFFENGVSCKLLFSIKMASNDVNDELERINKEASNFGLQAAVTGTSRSSIVGMNKQQTNSFSAEPNIIGRDDDMLNIVNLLVTAPQEQTVSIIPIVGMGGLGKTTLARKVFHQERIGAHFDKRIWVCVSVSFETMGLFKMILETLTGASVQGMQTEEAVLENIQKSLAGKKYMLVLDDVWNENLNEWDSFLSSLSGASSVKGNCIVVTTRSEIVASKVQTLSTRPLRTLSGDECWAIIKSNAFQRADVPIDLEEVGRVIAQQCGGLPLAAKVVGGLLRGKPKDEWVSILTDQLLRFGPGDTVTNILKLSYDRLPSYLHKRCFAYCSVFPQDFRISRRKLIEYWMAEGFLQAHEGRDMEMVGDEIFNNLLQNSLFQDVEWDKFGSIVCCKMHDLVHDLACSITEGMHRVRYLVIESLPDESDAISHEQMIYLRTLSVNGRFINDTIIYNIFPDLKCLHVLNLSGVNIEKIPAVTGRLIHLRLLNISQTGVKQLPESICKLYNLQSLWICISLKILPIALIEMISLRHLHISEFVELPPYIGRLTSLQTLPYYKVCHEKGRRIGELGNLKNLKGEIEIQNLEMVTGKKEAKQAGMFKKSKIVRLCFKWNESRQYERNDTHVLDGLQPNASLKSLSIVGYNGISFPPWTMKMVVHDEIEGHGKVLRNLIRIKLENCQHCEEVPMFGHLPHLRSLKLTGLSNVKSIGLSFYGFEDGVTPSTIGNLNFGEPMTVFPALEKLQLSNMTELSEWVEVGGEIRVFPCLKYLQVKECPKLNAFPSQLPCLERLTIAQCPELKSVPSHLPCLEELEVDDVGAEFSLVDVSSGTSHLLSIKIASLPGLTYFPEEVLAKNQNLKNLRVEYCHQLMSFDLSSLSGGSSLEELYISHCPELESIFPSAKGLTSLRRLMIWSCYKLKELPLNLNTIKFLEELCIHGCPRMESIIRHARGGDSQQQEGIIITSSLRVLVIRNCPGLTDLPIEVFQSCSSSLRMLTLVQARKLIAFPSREICCLNRSLVRLEIGGFSGSISFESFNQHLNFVLPNLHCLQSLSLHGEEDWDSLPDQIQHLTGLTELEIQDFGIIEALPEWTGKLSSLQHLSIKNCKRIRHLPSEEAIQSLTKLYTLWIQNCPLLADRCRNQQRTTRSTAANGSEWHKISHITEVVVR